MIGRCGGTKEQVRVEPWQGLYCVVFLKKTFNSLSAGVFMYIRE